MRIVEIHEFEVEYETEQNVRKKVVILCPDHRYRTELRHIILYVPFSRDHLFFYSVT